ncbi:mycofactocin biosynthesis glycosyltransferase MftF [Conexibacter sp. CPCC 206217]|uniref:mycofactocin biosynthesis glycosyltransferase MftF n=1 Tax=Conexibacter sp. CPCC 206217 TaxID=3064574 RepID=UPI0027219DD3|nr:mycofactocin biosynthesis glycosyltransferase MftF [Conexibacter sp. CPCC 206217]MDO8210279.1 mycofactocin biosynthesis glycosyltransferase MftF [Conexibacter sp. CPCC 206217]
MTSPPLPTGFGIRLDRRARVIEQGRALLGGTPTRMLRLTPAGADVVARWQGGELPDGAAARALARRLVDAGIAHPRPPATCGSPSVTDVNPIAGAPASHRGLNSPSATVTVVVPVRDRAVELDRCLAALAADRLRVLVIDDGSHDEAGIARVARKHGAEIVRTEQSQGAAAARNRGLERCATEHVAFVDSDCIPAPGWLDRLAAHLLDPDVAVAAPRIVAADTTTTTWIGRFEAERSPLDMGPDASAVAPLSRLPFVPSAALVVRRAAAGAGFDETMPIGEDIDLVWRIVAAGWTVRYDPSVTVAHHHRDTLVPWLRRRFVYATSTSALARRHPGALPVALLTPWAAATFALLAARRPLAALVVVTAVADSLRRRSIPPADSARLVATGLGWSAWSLSVAATRSWLPLALLASARSRRARRALLLASVLPRAVEAGRNVRELPLPLTLGLNALDDAAYAAGLWWGCARNRTAEPLLPRIMWSRPRAPQGSCRR